MHFGWRVLLGLSSAAVRCWECASRIIHSSGGVDLSLSGLMAKNITPVLLTLADNLEDPIHISPFGTSKSVANQLEVFSPVRPSLGVGKLTSLFAADHTDKEKSLLEENSVVT